MKPQSSLTAHSYYFMTCTNTAKKVKIGAYSVPLKVRNSENCVCINSCVTPGKDLIKGWFPYYIFIGDQKEVWLKVCGFVILSRVSNTPFAQSVFFMTIWFFNVRISKHFSLFSSTKLEIHEFHNVITDLVKEKVTWIRNEKVFWGVVNKHQTSK